MVKKHWDVSPRMRRLILACAAIDGGLKAAALIDLARRPAGEIRGRKPSWAAAILLINSAGAVPIAYFICGRRR